MVSAGPLDDMRIRIDGRQALSAESVAVVLAACDEAEDRGGQSRLIFHVSGSPGAAWETSDLPIALVSKWERALRRLERLRAASIAVADGDCGGLALDTLLATDYRIATATARLRLPEVAGAAWPGMALYRLARQAAGAAPVRRAVMFGTPIGAGAALAIGVIDDVAADVTAALAQAAGLTIATGGPELAVRRQLILEAPAASFEDALGVHLAACDRVLRRATGNVA
jgi:isomerase DpgB